MVKKFDRGTHWAPTVVGAAEDGVVRVRYVFVLLVAEAVAPLCSHSLVQYRELARVSICLDKQTKT